MRHAYVTSAQHTKHPSATLRARFSFAAASLRYELDCLTGYDNLINRLGYECIVQSLCYALILCQHRSLNCDATGNG